MKTKNNTFKRIAAGAIATVSVAANVMSANVGGAVVDSLNAVLVASAAAQSTLAIDNAKQYLSEITFDGETYTAFKSIHTFDVPANSDVVIKATAKLTNFYNGPTLTTLSAGVTETFEDGKWVYSYKQNNEVTLTVSDATNITYDTNNASLDKQLDPKKIVSWKIGNGGEGKEYTREAGDETAAKNITGAALGETVEITSTELLDFTPGVAYGIFDDAKNAKPARTVANGAYTYKFSANSTAISKGTHMHSFEVIGLTADKTALEIQCKDTVDGTHDKPYSVFVSVFNYTKVPGADKATKETAIDTNGIKDQPGENVLFSEVTDRNYNFGNVAPGDAYENFGFGVYNDTSSPAFSTAKTFAGKANDNISIDNINNNIVIACDDGTQNVYQIGDAIVYDKDNKEVANSKNAATFYATLNTLPVGSYTMKYTITFNKQGADIIDEEGGGSSHLGTGDNSSSNKYVLEIPMNIVQADMAEENFGILNGTPVNLGEVDKRYWTFEYDENTRYTPQVQVPGGLTEGVDYKLEGDVSASRIGDYTIYVVGLGNFNFKYALNWKIVDNEQPLGENFIVTPSDSTYGDSVYDAVKDSLSFKNENYVYTYYWKPKDQTDNPNNDNVQDKYTAKEDWERDLKSKGYNKVTEDLILNVNEYTITVLAENVDTNETIRTLHDNFLTIRKAPATITIIGKTVTFDGNSHIEDAQASVISAKVYKLTKNLENEWVKDNEISVSDAHADFAEAAKDIQIDATIVNTFNNAVEPDDELTERAKVIHAGAYKLAFNAKSYALFTEEFGNNYDIEVNTNSNYVHDAEAVLQYNVDLTTNLDNNDAYIVGNNQVNNGPEIGIDATTFATYWGTITADQIKTYLNNNLFPEADYDVVVNDTTALLDKKSFNIQVTKKAVRSDYADLTDETITTQKKNLKYIKMFGFGVNLNGLINNNNTNTLIILPAELRVEVKKDTYVYNDSLIKPEFTVYGIDNKPITADYYDIEGARSAMGSDDKNTQYYTIINGVSDYQCSQDAFNWKITNNAALRNAAKVTYGDTTSVLKDGKQRVTYTINRELLKTAPAGTKITDAGLLYYNGVDAGKAQVVDAHKLIDKVGTYIDESDKTNIVKKAHVAASQLSNNKAALTVNVLDNGYGTVVLGFVEVTDADGNSAIIYGEISTTDELTGKVNTVKPAALNKSYASANVEAEKAAQAAIDVEILPFDANKNGGPNVEYDAKAAAALPGKKGYSYTSNDKKNRVTFEIQRSVKDTVHNQLQNNENLKALADYDYEITEYGLYYYNGLNDIPESALTNQWVGKVPQGQTKNADKTNVVKQAHVTRESATSFKDEGILQVNVVDNGNGVKARGFVCVTLYKKGTLNTANPVKIYETTIYSSDKAVLTNVLATDKQNNKYFDDENNLEVYKNSVVERNYDEIVKNAINDKIGIDGASTSVKGDNYQAVSIKAKDNEENYGFNIVEYGVVYSAYENATAENLTLDKVNGTTIKKESIVKNMADGTTGSVTVDGTDNKKYRVYLVAKDAEGNSTVIYPEELKNFSETAPNAVG